MEWCSEISVKSSQACASRLTEKSIHLNACNVVRLRLSNSQERPVLASTLLLVNHDVVPHEAQETIGVLRRRDGRNARTMSEHRVLRKVLQLLVHVEVLQVVDDANVVDVAATLAEELVPAAFKA